MSITERLYWIKGASCTVVGNLDKLLVDNFSPEGIQAVVLDEWKKVVGLVLHRTKSELISVPYHDVVNGGAGSLHISFFEEGPLSVPTFLIKKEDYFGRHKLNEELAAYLKQTHCEATQAKDSSFLERYINGALRDVNPELN